MRFRLYPNPAQEQALLEHCDHARFVWNLALEQRLMWRRERGRTPAYAEQNRQLTDARAASSWLAAGSQMVQQQALRDLDQAWRDFFAGVHGKPTWRKARKHEGFRVVGPTWHLQVVGSRSAKVRIPKIGWVRFRRSREVRDAKSYRITRDRAGRWHVAFALIPDPVPGPDNGEVVGIDRGVTVSLALSDGRTLHAPVTRSVERLQRRLSRAKRGSNRRADLKHRLARVHARNADALKDWAEKASTDVARNYDLIRIEDLRIKNMTRSAKGTVENPGRNVRQKAGLNRAILRSGWGLFARRLEQKAPGRVERVDPAYTSQRCSACGHIAAESRESQALFRCVACGHTSNADLNAARNIAAGYAVAARGGPALAEPLNREPIPPRRGGCQTHFVLDADDPLDDAKCTVGPIEKLSEWQAS